MKLSSFSVALLASLANAESSIRNSGSRELAQKPEPEPKVTGCSAYIGLWEALDVDLGSDGSKFTASFRCQPSVPAVPNSKCDIVILLFPSVSAYITITNVSHADISLSRLCTHINIHVTLLLHRFA